MISQRDNTKKRQRLIVGSLLVTLLLVIIVLLYRYPLDEIIDHDKVASLITRYGVTGVLAFVFVGVGFTAVGLPRQLMAFIGGYTFGFLPGVLLGTLAAIGGCLLTFSLSRYCLRGWVGERFARVVNTLNGMIRQDPFLKIVVLRLQPFGTNLATNLAAGVTDIPARVFIASSLLGYIPQMVVFALTGSGVRVQSSTQVGISIALFALSLLLAAILYRRHLLRRQDSR
ncbi:MAG: VTT domain-containing protein [Gammaproteobacteria bacterium]|nr:VTT domain-containing protein [Gammaproteobacteria bacterium]